MNKNLNLWVGKTKAFKKFLRSKKRYNVYTIKLRLGDEEDQEGECSVKDNPGRQMIKVFWDWRIISSSNKTVKHKDDSKVFGLS